MKRTQVILEQTPIEEVFILMTDGRWTSYSYRELRNPKYHNLDEMPSYLFEAHMMSDHFQRAIEGMEVVSH